MNILFKLIDTDFGLEQTEMKDCGIRNASRGIVMRDDGKIAIQYKINKNEYKLVGGGMEENEDPNIAFKREVLEEAGCEIEIINQLGIIEEYRSLKNLKQISNIFIAKVTKELNKLALTEKEKIEGAKLLWLEPREALQLITDCYDKLITSEVKDVYNTRFAVLRDRKILEYYINEIMNKIMKIKVVTGGILEKNGKFLLVQENQKICKGKWNIPAGRLDGNESVIEGAKREIFEETGCQVEITGLLGIINEILEGINVVVFIFDTKIRNDNVKVDGIEIANAKWFTYEELLNMKDELRADGYFLSTIRNKIDNKIQSLDIINLSKDINE